MGDLTTLTNARGWIEVKGTDDDVLLERLISGVSAAVEQRVSRTFASASYTETRNGTGKQAMPCRNFPVSAVSSVSVDGVVIPARTSPTGSGFFLDSDFIGLSGYSFTYGRQNVVLAYTAGFATTPLDVEQAVLEIVAFKYKERKRIGLGSEMLGQQTTSYLRDVPPDCLRVIDNYKAVALAGFDG